ncbi:hypothetical protein HYPSUDRAFT_215971 [Hypholoma sublateritium FD-334 SS-4]|uniref:F-box domain-containing protein n=1 Tax=Hypholoma sublateritium (strain FD-334 SS-4) TaxID=945553 RepID=A0A0D2L5L7_HYPSF|nr:hypothetical protein HYPSUDRAFT_215971 [Hypholoma sublateritium FD-334 SS-4]
MTSFDMPIDSSSLSYLNELPFDLKDNILDLIEEPRHLISMALTCKGWLSMIIPNHLEYRQLCVYWPGRQDFWAHLALRADLANNVRSLRLTTKEDPAFERLPKRLLQSGDTEEHPTAFGPDTVQMITEAILNLKSLKAFTWVGSQGHSMYTIPIFEALHECANLEELHMVQMFPRLESSRLYTSLLKHSNLKKLTLHGKVWSNFFEIYRTLVAFIDQSPELEELTISYNPMSTLFTSCALTHLTKLHLYAESSSAAAALSSDTTILDFIVSHPSIQDLKWYPRDERLEIPQGVLPNLRRLYTKDRIAKILLNDMSVAGSRKMEVISQISLGPNTVNLLQNMDGTNIQELHLWRFEDLEQIDGISGLFPNIKTIDIPNIIQAGRNTVDDCIETLSRFPLLERFLDSSLWLAMHTMPQDFKQDTINRLGAACPNLRSLGHWKVTNRKPWEIVLRREGGEVKCIERLDPDDIHLYK